MLKAVIFGIVGVFALSSQASALCTSYPNSLSNGTTADASQVMANFNCAALTSGATLGGTTFTGATTFPGSTTINSSGNIGIGMVPTNILDITQNQNNASVMSLLNTSTGNSAASRLFLYNGSSIAAFSMYGTGFTSSGMTRADGAFLQSNGGGGLTIATVSGATPIYFGINGSEVGRIDGSNRFLWGTTSPAISGVKAEFDNNNNNVGFYMSGNVNSAAAYFRIDYTTPQFIDFLYGASTQVGSISTNGTATSYNTTSDERLKDWGIPQKSYESVIRSLWVGDFAWRSNEAHDFGIRAQQAYRFFPTAIHKPSRDDGHWEADYSKLAPLALWGVKDIYKLIDEQGKQLAALRQVNDSQATEIGSLKAARDTEYSQIALLRTQMAELQHRVEIRTAQN